METSTLEKIEKARKLISAIGHPIRQNIVSLLFYEKFQNVTQIYQDQGIQQATASHHLSVLKDAGLVSAKRDGKMINYSLKPATHSYLMSFISKL